MGAQYIPDIKRKLIEGISLDRKDKVQVNGDGTLSYKRQNVVSYIRDWYGEKNLPKYHIVNCETIQDMQRQGNYSRYVCAKPKNGQFTVNRPNHIASEMLNLSICLNCLKEIGLRDVYKPNEFPLSDWLDAIDEGYGYEAYSIDRINNAESYYIAAWKFLSWLCRKNAYWKCQECGIELRKPPDRKFLHAHHTKGTRYNHPEDLIALCIQCHSRQPGEGHEQLKTYPEYQEFMKKYGNVQQTNTVQI